MKKLIYCRPNFTIKHFKNNLYIKKKGKIKILDLLCFIHAITFGFIFFKRDGIKHTKANNIHLK